MELNGTVKKKTALGGTMNQTQTLSGTMSRSGGGAGVTEVFWAIYGTTTASEIRLAAQANKLVVCEHDGKIFYLGDVTISSVWFVNLSNRGTRVTTLRCLGDTWTSWTDDKTEDMVVVTFGQINLDDEGTISTSTVTANKTAEALFTAHQSGKDVVGFAPVYVHDSLHGTNTAGYYVQFAMTSWEQPELDDPQNVVSFTGVFPPTETDSLVGVSGGRITLTAKTGYTFSVSLDYGTPAFFTSDMKTKLAALIPYTSNPSMDGTASPGNSSAYARGNHVHPHDTSKLDAPSGGSVGQVLKKTANGTEWANESGGSSSTIIPSGVVDSTSTSLAFTATVSGITSLQDGVCVYLKNGVATSELGATLDVNGLGAKPIYISQGIAVEMGTQWNSAYSALFIYNSTRFTGGCWDFFYGYDSNTTYTPAKLGFGYATCDTAAATSEKTAALSSYTLTTGGIVSVKFTNAVGAGATLNINSKGAKAIYHRGAAIAAGVIEAGDTATFIYSTYYHLIAIDKTGGGTSDVFWATYGTTTLAELQAAWSDGKTILISYQGNVYYLSSVTGNNNSSFVFRCPSWSTNGRAQLYELINSYGTWNYSAYEGSDYILAPSSPTTGAFLVWNGSAWTAQTLSTWQGGSY